MFFLALVGAVTLAGSGAFALDETPSPTPSTRNGGGLTPIPDAATTPDALMSPGALVPTYECMPDADCVLRACDVGPSGQHWFRADYLLWWTRGVRVVPLVTTSNPEDGGIIGEPSTEILFGNERIHGDSRSNMRFRFGSWLHCGRTSGVEFDFMSLGDSATDFRFSSNQIGQPLYARPFYDVFPQIEGENAELVSHPDYLRGTVDGRVGEYFHSAGVNLRMNLCCHSPCGSCCGDEACGESCEEGCDSGCSANTRAAMYCNGLRGALQRSRYRVDLIAGYRNYQLNDSLRVNEHLYVFEDHEFLREGTTFDMYDDFRSRNEFHGAELGVITQFHRCRWSLELLAKMAIGNNRQTVNINGETTLQAPNDDPVTVPGGLLALDTNMGRYTRDEFVVIPQFGAEIGYQLTCRLRAYVGYNFIYWANVARAGEQIDYYVNSSYIPQEGQEPSGPARPRFDWKDSNFWAQGI
ncbi:MAG: BBP7 family outer membrane beta-barrel protein, partial [Pirellulaceae bacterium]|nr:BBP7 family outer membrane beta-barrel protein [Pirellulaceae bacterium]